jgi:hypothetical protein
MKTMRSICGMDKLKSLRAMLMCIETIEKNFMLDDDVTDEDYEVLIYYLDKLYLDFKQEYLKEFNK